MTGANHAWRKKLVPKLPGGPQIPLKGMDSPASLDRLPFLKDI